MNLDTFFTMQNSSPAAQKATAGKATTAPGNQQRLDFINMILQKMLEQAQDAQATAAQAEEATALQSNNPLLDKNPSLNLAELLAADAGIKEEVENFITAPGTCLTPEQQLQQTMMLNQKALDNALSPATDGIITSENVENGSPRLMQALLIDTENDRKGVLNNLQMILNKLQKLANDKTGAGLALSNLTPDQITKLQEKLNALLAKGQQTADDDKEIADIVLGMVKLLPPPAQPTTIILSGSIVMSPKSLHVSSNESMKAANDLAGKLNDLVVGEAPEGLPEGETDFQSLLKQMGGKKNGNPDLQLVQNLKAETPAVKADLSTLQNWPFANDGTLLAPQDYSTSPQAMTITGLNNLTNPIMNAPMAGASHPATQMVAIQLQKYANDGQNRNFSLQLDPPELGKIEVRMAFGKDKSIKAVVTAEKPETLAMLQRDSHFLERALQNAGLDVNNGSLSFELAGDGHFEQNGGHDGSRNGTNNPQAEYIENIESTMNWYVDAHTGHLRYDLLA